MTAPEAAPFIRLDQLLKLTGTSESGGKAKGLVLMGQVKVNGEVETRRGRKLRVGDRVEVAGDTIPITEALLRRNGDA